MSRYNVYVVFTLRTNFFPCFFLGLTRLHDFEQTFEVLLYALLISDSYLMYVYVV